VADGGGANSALVGAGAFAAGSVDDQGDRAVGQVVEHVGPAFVNRADDRDLNALLGEGGGRAGCTHQRITE